MTLPRARACPRRRRRGGALRLRAGAAGIDDLRLAVSRAVAVAVETSRGFKLSKTSASHKIDVVVALSFAALAAVEGGAAEGAGVVAAANLRRQHLRLAPFVAGRVVTAVKRPRDPPTRSGPPPTLGLRSVEERGRWRAARRSGPVARAGRPAAVPNDVPLARPERPAGLAGARRGYLFRADPGTARSRRTGDGHEGADCEDCRGEDARVPASHLRASFVNCLGTLTGARASHNPPRRGKPPSRHMRRRVHQGRCGVSFRTADLYTAAL